MKNRNKGVHSFLFKEECTPLFRFILYYKLCNQKHDFSCGASFLLKPCLQ